jgi:hypothetical protein
MCMYNNHRSVKRFVRRHKDKPYLLLRKVVQRVNGKLVGLYREEYKYKAGWNKAVGRMGNEVKLQLQDTYAVANAVEVGMHVNTTAEANKILYEPNKAM